MVAIDIYFPFHLKLTKELILDYIYNGLLIAHTIKTDDDDGIGSVYF